MEITITQREEHDDSKQPCFTLTVGVGEKRIAVNISRHEAYRTIDAHNLTPYEPIERDLFRENTWDDKPTSKQESSNPS
jgi:hypothetical protein